MFRFNQIYRRATLALVPAATIVTLSACGSTAADTDTLVFAAAPSENSSSVAENYGLVIEVLEKELGVKVEFQNVTSYAALVEAQQAGRVDIAAYGPFTYATAVDSGVDAVAVVAGAKGPEEGSTYRAYGLVPAGSAITNIDGFKDKTVCFVDPTSTSGYLYPSAGLIEAGIDPENDVRPVFAGGHDASALSIADGACDAGFAYDGIIDKLTKAGSLSDGALEVVWESEDIASQPIAVHNQVGEERIKEIQRIFAEKINVDYLVGNGYCTSEDDCALPLDLWGFVPTTDQDYDGIRTVCDITEAEACEI